MKALCNLFTEVIKTKKFKLDDMTAKIKRSYISGDITEKEQAELLSLVNENLDPETERPDWLTTAHMLLERIEALEKKVNSMTSAPEDSTEATPDEETPKYEKWAPWNGISNKYQYGDIVEHNNGVLYESIYHGLNVWEPGIPGTEGVWRVYEA
jgi:hypothetical protein